MSDVGRKKRGEKERVRRCDGEKGGKKEGNEMKGEQKKEKCISYFLPLNFMMNQF